MNGAVQKAKDGGAEIARFVPKGLERGLRNYWYPVLQTVELPEDTPVAFKVLGETLVAWRNREGRPNVLRDKCPHRGAKLSAGHVLAGNLQCAWHGLRFDGVGRCTMIPWEPDDSNILKQFSVNSYRADELGGYIWAYIGDATRFPPPPLRDSVPEELLDPERFITFRLPTVVWNANWLQCLDGSDAYHAVMLHSGSQAVANKAWTGGKPTRPSIPLEKRRMKIIKTSKGERGVALDLDGQPIQHGHFLDGWKGERWILPCLHTIPILAVPNADPYVSRNYQFAIDETHTQTVRFVSWRVRDEKHVEEITRLWNDVVYPRQLAVAGEDQMIIETLGDLAESRSEEMLLAPDQDIIRVRRKIAEAYLAQEKGHRPTSGNDDFVFPV